MRFRAYQCRCSLWYGSLGPGTSGSVMIYHKKWWHKRKTLEQQMVICSIRFTNHRKWRTKRNWVLNFCDCLFPCKYFWLEKWGNLRCRSIYQSKERPHITTSNLNPRFEDYWRWVELLAVANLLVGTVSDSHLNSWTEPVKNIPYNSPHNERLQYSCHDDRKSEKDSRNLGKIDKASILFGSLLLGKWSRWWDIYSV